MTRNTRLSAWAILALASATVPLCLWLYRLKLLDLSWYLWPEMASSVTTLDHFRNTPSWKPDVRCWTSTMILQNYVGDPCNHFGDLPPIDPDPHHNPVCQFIVSRTCVALFPGGDWQFHD